MRKSLLVILTLALALALAGAAQAQSTAQFWLGGGLQILLMNGTGTLTDGDESIDFDLSDPMDGDTSIGLNWGNKMLLGIKPMAGVKINNQFGFVAGYSIFLSKDSDDSYSYDDGYYTATESYEFSWSQKNLTLMAQFFPSASQPGLYLLAGVDMVSFEIETKYAYEEEYEGVPFTYSGTDKNDDSTTGLIFGVGYDASAGKKSGFFGNLTYSLAKYDDTALFEDEVDGFEVKVGGLSAEFGIKFLLGGN